MTQRLSPMRFAIVAALAVATGSSQAAHAVVRPIGLHPYVVTDAGKQVFAKANATRAKALLQSDSVSEPDPGAFSA